MDASFSTYDQGRMAPGDIATIEEGFGDAVKVIRSTNFSNSIGAEVERWRRPPAKPAGAPSDMRARARAAED